MLMSISFPAIVSEWVGLDSLAFSSINEVLSDKRVASIAKPVGRVNGIFKSPAPVLLSLHPWSGVDAVELGQDIE